MLKVSLTHDVDRTEKTYQYFTHAIRALTKGNIKDTAYHTCSWGKRKQVYWNFDEIIAIEEKFGVKSTFFFLIESFPFNLFKPNTWKLSLGRYDIYESRIIDIINYLDKNGWEIGLHGSWASYNNIELLKKEKLTLEKILAHPVTGIRQHYLNHNESTWQIQNEAGFMYDSTWGYTRKIGYKQGKASPFFPLDNKFVVFPLPIMDSCYMNTSKRKAHLLNLIEQTEQKNGVLVINWHSNNYHEKEFPGYKDAYIEIIETCIEMGADFKPLKEFYTEYAKKSWRNNH